MSAVTARRTTAAIVLTGALAAACLVPAAPAAPVQDVLVIGDSLGVGTEPYLAPRLSGYRVHTDAEVGRGSGAGVDVLAETVSPADDVIVFALGSNDDPSEPESLAVNLERANALAAGRCLVAATLEVSELTGVSDDPLNDVIRSFAAASPNVRLVEWEQAVRPDLLADGGHATPEGYELRAGLFADAIASCEAATQPAAGSPRAADGIPNPDREALAERRDRRLPPPGRPRREPIGREEAIAILADSLASQIAIGALGAGAGGG